MYCKLYRVCLGQTQPAALLFLLVIFIVEKTYKQKNKMFHAVPVILESCTYCHLFIIYHFATSKYNNFALLSKVDIKLWLRNAHHTHPWKKCNSFFLHYKNWTGYLPDMITSNRKRQFYSQRIFYWVEFLCFNYINIILSFTILWFFTTSC